MGVIQNNKILIVRYGTIGDTVFSSAFLRELRSSKQDFQIDVLVDKIAGEIIEHCPYINNIHFVNGKMSKIFNYIKLFKNYRTVYFLKNDNFFTKVAFLAGVKNRIGFDIRRNFALTTKIPYTEQEHEIDCYIDLLKATNIKVNSDKNEVWIDDIARAKVQSLLQNVKDKKVIIQAYSRFSQKNWIDEYWVEIITYFSDTLGYQVYYCGSANDDYSKIDNLLDKNIKIKPINLCGKLSIQESMALISEVDYLIGIDSGLIHVAAALDKPSILLNGPTSLTRWKPRNNKCIVLTKNFECSPCLLQKGRKKYCKHKTAECMKALSIKDVIEKLETLVNVH